MRSSAERPQTQPQLRECPGCGLFQTVPALSPGMTDHCVRCPTILRRTSSHRIDHVIALTVAAFVLLVVMCTTTLMSVETAGIKRTANLFSGPWELVRQDMGPLALVIVFVAVLAPLGRLVGTLYVLIRLHEQRPPRHLRRVFALAERLRPWSMIEVFVFGVFVAYVKLGDLVTIGLMVGVYALLALTIVLVRMDSALDREAVWERLYRGNLAGGREGADGLADAVGCETCGLVSVPEPYDPRCDSELHERKPNSVARTWALVIAAAIFYIPANYYPVRSRSCNSAPASRARSSAASKS
jgi:paraquat-inducible protein A